jgi:hypothetical protein
VGYDIVLDSGEDDTGNNFGNYKLASKSGYKWEDLLPDGEWDLATEPALIGWTIELYDVTSGTPVFVAADTTDGDGKYGFTDLMPGKTYAVCEVLDFFYVQTFPNSETVLAPPAGESVFDCTVLGATYGAYGYEFYAASGSEFSMNNFGNYVPAGCTYTQGYWKTHSEYGPAPYDDDWEVLAGGADEPLFDSGLTWYEAFNTPPKKGNAWFILAHQWMAAYLNFHNGAYGGITTEDLADGAALLDKYDDDGDGDPFIPKDEVADREEAIRLAGLFGDYNEGIIGPGHCDD